MVALSLGPVITILALVFFFVLPYGDCLQLGGCERAARQHYASGVERYEAIQRSNPQTWSQLFRARTEFDMAIRDKPDFAEAYSYRALVHLVDNSRKEAVADCEKALSLEPASSIAVANCKGILDTPR